MSIVGDGCYSFCKHRHAQLKDGWQLTCDAYPDGNVGNDLFDCTRECANGIGFELRENADLELLRYYTEPILWDESMRNYLRNGTPGECLYCHSDAIHVYNDAPLTTRVTFVCYGCGKRNSFLTNENQYLNKRQLRYIGHNPLFPLTFGRFTNVTGWNTGCTGSGMTRTRSTCIRCMCLRYYERRCRA